MDTSRLAKAFCVLGLLLLLATGPSSALDVRPANFSETGVVAANTGGLVIPVAPSDFSKGWTVALNSASSLNVVLKYNDQVVGQGYTVEGGIQLYVPPETLEGGFAAAIELTSADNTLDSSYSILSSSNAVLDIPWDSGATALGDAPLSNPDSFGRSYYFRVNTNTATSGVWRTALKVLSGEANLYLGHNFLPNPNSHHYGSANVGDDGMTLNTSQYSPGQTWYLTVVASPGASWQLVTGAAHVVDLGLVDAVSPAASEAVTVGPEGLALFRADVGFDTLAWMLKTTGTQGNILVKKNSAPSWSTSGELADLVFQEEALIVPGYLTSGVYFVGVRGAPGSVVSLTSKNQEIRIPDQQPDFQGTDNFTFTLTSQARSDFGYLTYRLEVPNDRIGWQVVCTPLSGDPQLYIRQGYVPNPWNNNGLSESAGSVAESITQVPPSLSAGVWYVTVHGGGAFSFTLRSSTPGVTNVPYENYAQPIVNSGSYLNMAGWRYFAVTDLDAQAGSLAWELELLGYAPGTRLSIRRNAIPAVINYRTGDGTWVHRSEYTDAVSDNGYLLHRPHAQDIWYIGVGNDSTALGPFTLKTRTAQADLLNYVNGSASVSGQPSDRWRFFKVEVPNEGLGILLRLTNVTSGSPQLIIRRGDLPYDTGTQSTALYGRGEWTIGEQWSPQAGPISGRIYADDGTNVDGRQYLLGLGSPLSPGVYYVGVASPSGGEPLSYTIQCLGIGVGNASTGAPWPLQVEDMAFNGGSVAKSGLGTGDFAIYRVTVLDGTESWALKLTPTAGEAMINVRRGQIGNSAWTYMPYYYWYFTLISDSLDFFHGMHRGKAGDEYFYKYPQDATGKIGAGVYYITVQSEGQNPSDPQHFGAGAVDFNLESIGVIPVTDVGAPIGVNGSATYNGLSIPYGEQKVYRFSVGAGVKNLEVSLKNNVGQVNAYLCAEPDGQVGYPSFSTYGNEGGGNCRYQNSSADRINVLAPSGSYTLVVTGTDPNIPVSGCDLNILGQGDTLLAMNGGVDLVSALPPNSWKFYRVEVPFDAKGWKISLSDVTGGNPVLAVRKGEVPTSLSTPNYWMMAGATWDEGVQYSGDNGDITTRTYDALGYYAHQRDFTFGMDSPLIPGTYFVGVFNNAGEASSFRLRSRGIGFPGDTTDWAIKISDLDFTSGSASVSGLEVRDVAIYRVTVPDTAATWTLKLDVTQGEAMMNIRKDVLGNSGIMYFPYWYWYVGGPYVSDQPYSFHGTSQFKSGDEYFYKLPTDETGRMTPGVYYVTVHSEGQNPPNTYTFGTGGVDFTVVSDGEVAVEEQPLVTLSLDTPITFPGQSAQSGENKFYRVNIPAGFSGAEVELKNGVGNPYLLICQTYPGIAGFMSANGYYPAIEGGGYCQKTFSGYGLVNVANPDGVYMIRVAGDDSGGGDASYDLEVRAVGEAALDFVDGSKSVGGQDAGTWRFFEVEVPAQALGWRLALVDVTGGAPMLSVRKAQPPYDIQSVSPYDLTWYRDSWADGEQWGSDAGHISGNYYGPAGEYVQGREILLGMGTPLTPGTYFVGVMNHPYYGDGSPMTYRLTSTGIGVGNAPDARPWPLQVSELSFSGGSAVVGGLESGSELFYKVTVPPGAKSWALKLTSTLGSTFMNVRLGGLGSSASKNAYYWQQRFSDTVDYFQGAVRHSDGDDYFYKFPGWDQNTITPGDYYVTVYSEGISGSYGHYGTGNSAFTLTSLGEAPLDDASQTPLAMGTPMVRAAELAKYGENRIYRFALPAGEPNLEVILDNVSGSPKMELCRHDVETNVFASYSASVEGGGFCTNRYTGTDVVNIQTPAAGVYTLTVYSEAQNTDVEYDLKVSIKEPLALAFDGGQFTGGLRLGQIDYFMVDVPETFGGLPVGGMTINIDEYSGDVSQTAYRDLALGTIVENAPETVIVPPLLSPGRYYIVLQGQSQSQYRITVNPVRPARVFTLAANGGSIARPGLVSPMVGDSGVDDQGAPIIDPITQDQGTDLAPGNYHFYRIVVPENNGALMHVRLENISGNSDLYLRAGVPPTLSHRLDWHYYWSGMAYDRSITGSGSKYASWSPVNNRTEARLAPGDWWIAVHTGEANARYRIKLSSPNVLGADNQLMDNFGLVKALDAANGQHLNQTVSAGDMRFFKVKLPDISIDQPQSTPLTWTLRFSEQAGDVALFVRSDTPPGNYYDRYSFNDWGSDDTGHNYPSFETAGTVDLTVPPVKPGHTYYVGVYARSDAIFNIASSLGAEKLKIDGLIDFYGGQAAGTLAPGEKRLYAVNVPADATRWIHHSVHDSSVMVYIQQETPAQENAAAHYYSYGAPDSSHNAYLLDSYNGGYPWQPAKRYFITVKNDSAATQNFSLTFDGRNAATDDNDNDGLPDAWEISVFGHTWFNPWDDQDGDGASILIERLMGTDPTKADTDGDGLNDGIDLFPLDPAIGALHAEDMMTGAAASTGSHVTFTNTHVSPVVIVGPPTTGDPDPAFVKISNVTPSGFDAAVSEWKYQDGVHGEESFSYMVFEKGRLTLPDGSMWESGTFDIPGPATFFGQRFSSTFPDAPLVFATLQTGNGVRPEIVRIRNVNNVGFEAALFQEEAENVAHGPLTVGYVAVYAPSQSTLTVGGQPLTVIGQKTTLSSTVADFGLPAILALQEESSQFTENAHGYETVDLLQIGTLLFAQSTTFNEADPFTVRRYGVDQLNQPPAIYSDPPADSVLQDQPYSFMPSYAWDPEGDQISFRADHLPSWAVFDPLTGGFGGTPRNADVGVSQQIMVNAVDARGAATGLAPFTITVINVNDPPSISGAPPTAATYRLPYSFTPTASDPDVGDTLTYTIQNKPVWASFDPSTGTLSGAPGDGTIGVYSGIVIGVKDAQQVAATLPTFSITVKKAIPAVTAWPTASNLVYGETLAASTLTGGEASVGGVFAFAAPTTVPEVGTRTYQVTFTPAASANYSAVTGNVSVTIRKATPVITTWPVASSITYGVSLTLSTLTGGVASVPGSFAYTVPTTRPVAGTALQSVTFTPADIARYNTVTGTVSVTVNKGTPRVTTWPTASALTHGQTLAASTLSGGVATVGGAFAFTDQTLMPNAGTASQSVTFTPTDKANYNNVVGTVSVAVAKATPTISAWPTPGELTYGQTLASVTLTGGTASTEGTFAFTTPAAAPGVGSSSQSVTFTPVNKTNFNNVVGSVTVNVVKATPTVSAWPTAAGLTVGQPLSASILTGGSTSVPGTFAFASPTTTPGVGVKQQQVIFTPTNAASYNTVSGLVTVTVSLPTVALALNLTMDGLIEDSSGNGNTVSSSYVYPVADRFGATGQAANLFPPAVSGYYLKIADSSSLDTDAAFTLSTWVRLNSYATTGSLLFSKWFSSSSYGDYMLMLNSNGTLTFTVSNRTTTINTDNLRTTSSVATGEWVHVAATFDTGAMKVYINGTLAASKVSTIVTATEPTEYTNDDLYLGTMYNGAFRLNGCLDEVRVYGKALTEAEIALFLDYLPVPSLSLASGTYAGQQTVALTTAVQGLGIRYTLDGTVPTATTGMVYTTPLKLNGEVNLRAVTSKAGFELTSAVASADYTINLGPAGGLALYLPLDGNLKDSSGNNAVATTVNSTTVTDRKGFANRAYLFNSTAAGTSNIKVLDSAPLDADATFTLGAWVKLNSYNATTPAAIFSKWLSAASFGDYTLWINPNGTLSFTVANTDTGVIKMDSVRSATTVPLNTWTHVAATFNNGVMYVYINAIQQGTFTSTNVTHAETKEYNADDLYIGALATGAYRLNGMVDEVRVYNRSLSNAEVSIMSGLLPAPVMIPPPGPYTAPVNVALSSSISGFSVRYTTDGTSPTTTNGTLYAGTTIPVNGPLDITAALFFGDSKMSSDFLGKYTTSFGPADNLALYLALDGNLNDTSGKNSTVQGVNATPTADVWGRPSMAYLLDQAAVGGSRIKVLDNANLDTDTAFTLSAWVRMSAYGTTNSVIFAKWLSSASAGDYVIWVNPNGTISYNIASTESGAFRIDSLRTTAKVPLNTWTHVAFTFNNGAMAVHLNGSAVASKTSALVTRTEPKEYGSDDFYVGSLYSKAYPFNGEIDEVRLYGRALTLQEVGTLKSGVTGLNPTAGAPVLLGRAGVGEAFTAAAASSGTEPVGGETWTDEASSLTFTYIPAGTFLMGSDAAPKECGASPAHLVALSTGYWLARHEVTQAQWEAVMGTPATCPACPVENVNYEEIGEYLGKLSAKTGLTYQLPTEAQWEYAARSGGQATLWAGTGTEGDLSSFAWLAQNADYATHPVGTLLPNGYNLNDLTGNVAEWTRDIHAPYADAPALDPASPADGLSAALSVRGGSFLDDPENATTVCREPALPTERSPAIGFRVVVER